MRARGTELCAKSWRVRAVGERVSMSRGLGDLGRNMEVEEGQTYRLLRWCAVCMGLGLHFSNRPPDLALHLRLVGCYSCVVLRRIPLRLR